MKDIQKTNESAEMTGRRMPQGNEKEKESSEADESWTCRSRKTASPSLSALGKDGEKIQFTRQGQNCKVQLTCIQVALELR